MAVDFGKLRLPPPLQYLFRNKDDATPLAAGRIYFYEDDNHTVLKNIYVRTNQPSPNPEFVLADNPQTLTSAGKFDKPIYTYTFDEDNSSVVQTYFVEIRGALPGEVLQETLEGFPDIEATIAQLTSDVNNLYSNGQFRYFEDINIPTFSRGEIPPGAQFAETNVAYGGWTFNRTSGSSSTNFVTVERFTEWNAVPDGNPRNFVKLKCTSPDVGDVFKAFRFTLKDVNFMATDNKDITLQFEAEAQSASVPITVHLVKNFGTGGSPETDTQLLSTSITTGSYQKITIPMEFGTNDGKIIGTQDDDFIALDVRMPPGNTFELDVTDFAMKEGNLAPFAFPQETEALQGSQTLGGSLPKPAADGSSLYLPLVLNQKGFEFDDGVVGSYKATDSLSVPKGYYRADGSVFDVTLKSPDGVPNTRLFNKIGTRHGNGPTYVTAWQGLGASNNQLIIQHNVLGTASGLSAGTTGWALHPVHVGGASVDYFLSANLIPSSSDSKVLIKHQFNRVFTGFGAAQPAMASPLPVTSGFTIDDRPEDQYGSSSDNNTDNKRQYEFAITNTGASTLDAKKYSWIAPITAAASAYSNFYNWFSVDGVGADPGGAGTGIRTDLRSTDDARTVSLKIISSLRGLGSSLLLVTAPVAQSAYFEFTSSGTLPTTGFYVWYNIDGVGVDPGLGGKTGLEVQLTTAEAAVVDTIIQKTVPVINNRFFQVPDLRGMFLRGYDEIGDNDRASKLRFLTPGFFNNVPSSDFIPDVGSTQLDSVGSHGHPAGNVGATQTGPTFNTLTRPSGYVPTNWNGDSNSIGSTETRPINLSVNWFIHN